MAERPRTDHRTVIVHFAISSEQQIDRIAALGAIVSANPYYPVGFADKFAAQGLGPTRGLDGARGISASPRHPAVVPLRLPMAPADSAHTGLVRVNRRTPSGRVVCPEQRVSVHDALRAITIEAAYSWRMEDHLGSIAPGKLANFTMLGDDPYAVDPADLNQIPVLGTVYEGRWFPLSCT